GRPQAEAVALAHQQAPLAAQAVGPGDQRVPPVPPAPSSAPCVRPLRNLRWPHRRHAGRRRARPRSRSL
ncbi:MAG: hypothetical protein AVDCRST_MAG38-838, partial [uncultured Solirubrobacteraceae bacterium]